MKEVLDETGILSKCVATGALSLDSASLFELLKKKLNKRCKQAYVFGSRAREDYVDTSDLDLIIVSDTDKSFVNRWRDFDDLIDLVQDIDLLVYTPEEFSKLCANPTLGFWQNVTKEMRQIL